jgi:hypothetical protein
MNSMTNAQACAVPPVSIDATIAAVHAGPPAKINDETVSDAGETHAHANSLSVLSQDSVGSRRSNQLDSPSQPGKCCRNLSFHQHSSPKFLMVALVAPGASEKDDVEDVAEDDVGDADGTSSSNQQVASQGYSWILYENGLNAPSPFENQHLL